MKNCKNTRIHFKSDVLLPSPPSMVKLPMREERRLWNSQVFKKNRDYCSETHQLNVGVAIYRASEFLLQGFL